MFPRLERLGFDNMPKSVAIDFDATIHEYSRGFQDGSIYDPPIPGALEAIVAFDRVGYKVIILTARDQHQHSTIFYWLDQRLREMGHEINFQVTSVKPPAELYIDDRGLRFEGDWTRAIFQAALIADTPNLAVEFNKLWTQSS